MCSTDRVASSSLQSTLNKRDSLNLKETVPLKSGFPLIKVSLVARAHSGGINIVTLNRRFQLKTLPLIKSQLQSWCASLQSNTEDASYH